MTQQDGTGPGSGSPGTGRPAAGAAEPGATSAVAEPAEGAGPPGRGNPSPYLDGGGGIPEAYLAPPQPGLPRYGVPSGDRPALRSPAQRQPGPARSRYGQPGSARPGYGRPGARARAARDPAAASSWQRLTASCLDWLLILTVATAAFIRPLLHLWQQMQAIAHTYPDLSTPGAQAAISNVASQPASQHALLYWFLAIFGLALTYFWVQHAAWGATIGKRLLGTRVVTAADQARIGVRAAGIRAVAVIAGPALFLLLASPLSYIGGALWVADAAMVLLDQRARSLHDRVSGTVVVQERWLSEQRRSASPW